MKIQNIGGQAVINGIMLRSPHYCAVSIRKNGKIKTKVEPASPLRYTKLPVVRGIFALYDLLALGIKAMLWSAAEANEEGKEITQRDTFLLLASSMALAAFFFIGLPFFVTMLLVKGYVLFNVLDGVFRMAIFLGYVGFLSRMEDVKTLFRYHGAEHKVVTCYETSTVSLNNAMKCSRIHPRCGTTFVMVVLLASVLLFSLLPVTSLAGKLSARLILLPFLAGLSYELIRIAQRTSSRFIRLLITPGLWFQRMTTREPLPEEVEVGLATLNALIEREKANGA